LFWQEPDIFFFSREVSKTDCTAVKAQRLTTLSYEGSLYETDVLPDGALTEEDLPVRAYHALFKCLN
jgi:hypothetical protein